MNWAGGEEGEAAWATCSERQSGWERQVRGGVMVAAAGGLWEPLCSGSEVGSAVWGHTQHLVLLSCAQSLTHTCRDAWDTYLVPQLPGPQVPHLEEERPGPLHC